MKRGWQKLQALKLALSWTYESSKFLTVGVILISILGGLITFIEPYIFKLIIDSVTGSAKIAVSVVGVLVVYGIARITQSIFWDLNNLIRRVHSLRMERHVMYNLMSRISNLDVGYFEDAEYYNTLSRATGNIWRMTEVFWMMTFFLAETISVIVIVVALAAFDWRLVALVLFGAAPSLILTIRWAEVLWTAFSEASPIYRHATYYRTLLTEQPEAIKEIKTFGLREYFLEKFKSLFADFIKKQDAAALNQFKWYIVIGLVEGGFSVYAAWLVVKSFLAGNITIGELTFLWALLFQFASHARWVVRMIGDLNTHTTFLTPIVEVIQFEPKIKEPEKSKKFPAIKKGIEFRNVTFYYPRSKRPALKNVNLLIKPRQSIALVGENGSGKTTLIKLLCRLYDVSGGDILVDGINIKDFCLKELYANIGTIFQDFMKYEAQIEENIRFGKLSIRGHKKVHQAALKAGAWDFIRDFEKTYKTQVGKRLKEEGVELSVGQWQKIALARAFFRDAQTLILDEPTAAVDAKAEYQLFQRFRKLTKNKITLLISHRFSTVRMADKIVVIDKGRLIEQGSHEELMRKNGHYAKLFRLQAKGYK